MVDTQHVIGKIGHIGAAAHHDHEGQFAAYLLQHGAECGTGFDIETYKRTVNDEQPRTGGEGAEQLHLAQLAAREGVDGTMG